MSDEKWVTLLSFNPRKLFGLKSVSVNENEEACLSLFCPEAEWIYEEKNICSKSKNSPFTGKKLTGKVIGIINKDQVHLNS